MIEYVIPLSLDQEETRETGIKLNQANRGSTRFIFRIDYNSNELNLSDYDSARVTFQNARKSNIESEAIITQNSVQYDLQDLVFNVHGTALGYVTLIKDETVLSTLYFKFYISSDLINMNNVQETYIQRLHELVAEFEAELERLDLSYLDTSVSSRASAIDMQTANNSLTIVKSDLVTVDGDVQVIKEKLNELKTSIDNIDTGSSGGSQVDLDPVLNQVDVKTSTRASAVDIQSANNSLTTVKADLVTVKNNTDTLETSIATMNTTVNTINSNTDTLEPSVVTIKDDLAIIKTAVTQSSGSGARAKFFESSGGVVDGQVILVVNKPGKLKRVFNHQDSSDYFISLGSGVSFGVQARTNEAIVVCVSPNLSLFSMPLSQVTEMHVITATDLEMPFTSMTISCKYKGTYNALQVYYDVYE